MKNNLKGLALILLLAFTFSCNKNDDGDRSSTPEPELVTDVYVVGLDSNKATIWKNGVVTYLTDGTNFDQATDVFVSGTDVYVVGYE